MDLEFASAVEDRHLEGNKLQSPPQKKSRSSNQAGHETEESVNIVPFDGGELIKKFNALELVADGNEMNRQLQISTIQPKDSSRRTVDQR